MDELKVKKTFIKNHKRKSLSLHGRILEYKKVNQNLGDLLLAIKWIGNSGSHTSAITRDDTLDAFRILEYVLGSLYTEDVKELNKMAAQINKMKKPLSQIKKK